MGLARVSQRLKRPFEQLEPHDSGENGDQSACSVPLEGQLQLSPVDLSVSQHRLCAFYLQWILPWWRGGQAHWDWIPHLGQNPLRSLSDRARSEKPAIAQS